MSTFQDLSFFIDLDGAGWGFKFSLEQQLKDIIAAEGGEVVNKIEDASHAVLRHKQQTAYQAAVDLNTVSVVPPEWVIFSAQQKRWAAETGDILPGPEIPGMADHVKEVTVSGITGIDRVLTRYKVDCTGCRYSPAMSLTSASHVITTPEALAQPSQKIIAAMTHGIKIVRGSWLDQCLEEWQYVPEELYRLLPEHRQTEEEASGVQGLELDDA